MARPMPDAAPVTSATRPASGGGAGRRRSLRSSSSQYSTRNFSASSIGWYVDTDSAPRITLIAFTKNSPATRACCASGPKLHMPDARAASTITGSSPRIGGDSVVACAS